MHQAPQMRESGDALQRAPKSVRMQIGLFGKRNAGKSSIVNALCGQQVSIVSSAAGTTTDPVEKPMELLPLGPVLFIDTAGVDDEGALGELRVEKSRAVMQRCDLAVVVFPAGEWGGFEQGLAEELAAQNIPVILAANKCDLLAEGADAFVGIPEGLGAARVALNAAAGQTDTGVNALRLALLDCAPAEFIEDPRIIGDIVPEGSTVVLVIPVDKEAPKGRLILPQVQVMRDLLDSGSMPYACQVEELPTVLNSLKQPPALVVTDSQAFGRVAQLVPEDIPLTGFSVAFSRFKGDLASQVDGIRACAALTPQSRVLIAEACTHHPIEEDIGTVKIPRLLRKRVGEGLTIDHVRGADFPDEELLASYDLVIHCGACTFNRRMMLGRVQRCLAAGVPITNYGMVLAFENGIFERAIAPFASALAAAEAGMEATSGSRVGADGEAETDATTGAGAGTGAHADAGTDAGADEGSSPR